MKFVCPCGEVLVDQTDALPFKAAVIRDQDSEALLDRLEAIVEVLDDLATTTPAAAQGALTMRRGARLREALQRAWGAGTDPLYQCPVCGRLHLFTPRRRRPYSFQPSPDVPHDVLALPPVYPPGSGRALSALSIPGGRAAHHLRRSGPRLGRHPAAASDGGAGPA